jgi:hypothetical protein
VAAEEVLLKGEDFLRLDTLVGEFAEACVDAVDGFAGGEKVVEATACALDPFAGGWCEREAFDLAVKETFRVIEGQAVAGEFEIHGDYHIRVAAR